MKYIFEPGDFVVYQDEKVSKIDKVKGVVFNHSDVAAYILEFTPGKIKPANIYPVTSANDKRVKRGKVIGEYIPLYLSKGIYKKIK